ncbi:MAG: hypothetical protein OXH72_01290 [Caldilineaceae bacterium]|nr:hypothetical protein [Caldilineaceae bacterium]
MIDHEALNTLARSHVVPRAAQHFNRGGEIAVSSVIRTCAKVFDVIDPAHMVGTTIVLAPATSDYAVDRSKGQPIVSLHSLLNYLQTGFVLEINPDTSAMFVWHYPPPFNILQTSINAVVFAHHQGSEHFLIAKSKTHLPRLYAGRQSFFSRPSYITLEETLEFYRTRVVPNAECEILKQVWYCENKLFLKAKPEDNIRDSLIAFLRASLRFSAEVMPEQNVNPKNPVDIRVTFLFSPNPVALIEIKWLGKSKSADDNITVSYNNSRAVQGACQLINYLDSFSMSSHSLAKGYLVVLDGRRAKLNRNSKYIEVEHGLRYRDSEIVLPTELSKRCAHSLSVIRMFAPPKCI